uniref:DnaT-like ssDNA-binding domain-containing protein n=1 Tax=Ningiella ruwaisensis TaxID=2364274 RepID=UPI00109F18DA|nr:DnaT-like ssDNA-binding domain-containing protein [Ningiella ruwaisensis]
MNDLELSALQQAISNEARVLYCLYLRPQVSTTDSVLINNRDILDLLNAHSESIKLGRQISALFKQLYHVGLIRFIDDAGQLKEDISFDKSLNHHIVKLPLIQLSETHNHLKEKTLAGTDVKDANTDNLNHLHQQHEKMHIQWRPDEALFTQICQLVGLIDMAFDADEIGEFIAYWMGRPENKHTHYQWTQKFVIHLKHRRIKQPSRTEQHKVGHQWVEPKAGISFDENVKKLVSKYSG